MAEVMAEEEAAAVRGRRQDELLQRQLDYDQTDAAVAMALEPPTIAELDDEDLEEGSAIPVAAAGTSKAAKKIKRLPAPATDYNFEFSSDEEQQPMETAAPTSSGSAGSNCENEQEPEVAKATKKGGRKAKAKKAAAASDDAASTPTKRATRRRATKKNL